MRGLLTRRQLGHPRNRFGRLRATEIARPISRDERAWQPIPAGWTEAGWLTNRALGQPTRHPSHPILSKLATIHRAAQCCEALINQPMLQPGTYDRVHRG